MIILRGWIVVKINVLTGFNAMMLLSFCYKERAMYKGGFLLVAFYPPN